MKLVPLTREETEAVRIVLRRLDRDIEEQVKMTEGMRVVRAHLADQLIAQSRPTDINHADHVAKEPSTARGRGRPKGATRQRRDLDKIAVEIALELAPEFTSHEFQARGLQKYPEREDEFTRLKVKKRLRRIAGFDDAPITLIAKGGGRRPPRFRVNTNN